MGRFTKRLPCTHPHRGERLARYQFEARQGRAALWPVFQSSSPREGVSVAFVVAWRGAGLNWIEGSHQSVPVSELDITVTAL